jgi:flagellar assembly protein FliH
MSNVIPKEQLSAYQRWELASFDAPPPPTAEEVIARLEKGNQEARLSAYTAGQEEGRAAGFEQGRAEGFEQGQTTGQEQGYAQGLADGRAQAAEEKAQLLQIAQLFSNEITHASERVASDVLELALDLSKAMLKSALNVRPELVIPVVSDAIRHLPTVQRPARLILHPSDAQLTKAMMADELDQAGWCVIEDPQMEPGGCRVETATNQIDASITTRWQRIAAALGKDSDWLAR